MDLDDSEPPLQERSSPSKPMPTPPSAPRCVEGAHSGSSTDMSLLERIRAQFRQCARPLFPGGDNSTIGTEDLARYWCGLAEEERYRFGHNRLTVTEKQAIALRVAQTLQEMDIKQSGQVTMEEWVHYMLLTQSGFAGKQINSLLASALAMNKHILVDLQEMFERADLSKSGTLSIKEIVQMYSRKLWHLRPGSNARPLSNAELVSGNPETFAREIIEMMDVDGDEQITYPEFMAYCLGRRKQEVTLNLYDLSNGAAEALGPYLVGQEMPGIWHTGVVAFGKEYYYAKDTVFDEPGATSFGQPTQVIHLGYTLWRQEELHEYVVNELKPVFHRDTYDVVTNNCNHFSDRVCAYLLGRHLPKEVLQQPDLLLQSNFVRVLRPMLNWYLRDRVAARDPGKDLPPGRPRIKPGDRPAAGSVVAVHPVEGTHGSPILARVKERGERTSGIDDRGWFTLLDACSLNAAGCSEPRVTTEQDDDSIVVQYFDVQSSQHSGACRAHISTEIVPCKRLSDASDPALEALYCAAAIAIGVTAQSSASHGQPLMANGGRRPEPGVQELFPEPPPFPPGPSLVPFAVQSSVSAGSHGGSIGAALSASVEDAKRTVRSEMTEDSSIDALVRRGFEREAAEAALHSADWRPEKALRLLQLGPGRDGDGRVSQL